MVTIDMFSCKNTPYRLLYNHCSNEMILILNLKRQFQFTFIKKVSKTLKKKRKAAAH